MPDMSVRSWITSMARLFQRELSANDIEAHSQLIGLNNANKLLRCIRPSGTHTVREIVRALCSIDDLLTKESDDVISEVQRIAIRSKYYLIKKIFIMKL